MLRLALSPRRVVIGLLVAVAAVAANPTWAAAVGIDVWNLPRLQEQLAADTALSREFDLEDVEIKRRMELKDRLVCDLIEGRTTLAAVTVQFLALNRNHPGYMTMIRANHPGRTDEERTARNILQCASYHLAKLPQSARDAAEARLEAELAKLVASSPGAE